MTDYFSVFLSMRHSRKGSDRNKRNPQEKPFIKNGGLLLEEKIKSCERNHNPLRIFSKRELEKATNHYDEHQIFHKEGPYNLYKGQHEDRNISVKKFNGNNIRIEDNINEIVIASQMSDHKNVLWLIGCCIETEFPVLVYEFVSNGNLSDYIFKQTGEKHKLLSWDNKLRIATEIANTIAYLHMSKSNPIIHRGIKSYNIFLDENYVAKLPGFTFSLPIPTGETHVQAAMVGTVGYIDPETETTGKFTTKSDVYSFGVVLLEILTGNHARDIHTEVFSMMKLVRKDFGSPEFDIPEAENLSANEATKQYLATNILREGNEEQLMACAELALRCVEKNSEERPTIKEVTKELRRIQTM